MEKEQIILREKERKGEKSAMTKLIERRKNNITTYSHLTIKLHTILYTLYQFLHFKQTLNAKSFQYDANTSKREERDGQSERERESAVVEHESASNEREKHLQSSQLSSK